MFLGAIKINVIWNLHCVIYHFSRGHNRSDTKCPGVNGCKLFFFFYQTHMPILTCNSIAPILFWGPLLALYAPPLHHKAIFNWGCLCMLGPESRCCVHWHRQRDSATPSMSQLLIDSSGSQRLLVISICPMSRETAAWATELGYISGLHWAQVVFHLDA